MSACGGSKEDDPIASMVDAHDGSMGEEGTDDDGKSGAVASLDPLGVIWDCSKIEKYIDPVLGKMWRCNHCRCNPIRSHNATKALMHVLKIKGYNVSTCKALIPNHFLKRYKDL